MVVVRLIDDGGGPVGSVTPMLGTGALGTAGTAVVRVTIGTDAAVPATASIVTVVVAGTAVGGAIDVNGGSSGARSAGVDPGDARPRMVAGALVVVGTFIVAAGFVVAVSSVVVVTFATTFLVVFLTTFFVDALAPVTAPALPSSPTASVRTTKRDRRIRASKLTEC